MNNSLNEKAQQYLYYGYAQKKGRIAGDLDAVRSKDNPSLSPKEAAEVFDACLDDLFQCIPQDGCVVVPISGGWDSRILLGAAMERFERSRIKTVSFGVPGQLDFDIGGQIASKFGLEHHAFDLSKVELIWENLLASVEESPWTYVPDGYFNRLAVSQVARSSSDVVLSGFMGDPLTGGHLSRAITPVEALEEFTKKQRREKRLWLPLPEYDPKESLRNIMPQQGLCCSDILDFEVRQASCIASIVTPQDRWNSWGGDIGSMPSTGAKVLAPFVHPKWAAYWLAVPNELKMGQKLYLEVMMQKFPELAAMPSKYSLGTETKISFMVERVKAKVMNLAGRVIPQLGVRYSKSLNYVDFARAFRKRDDYRNILEKAITYLKENQVTPWLDLDKIKDQHMEYKANHENALLILIGLALNFEAENSR